VLEETYNSSTGKTTLSAVNVYGADGWRVRDYPGPTVAATDDVFYAFSFDPQGNVVSKMDSDNTANPGYDLASYEGYGHRAADILAGTGQSPAPHQDPARFGGEYGYYTDYSTGLLCLTHRYYDPGTGRFVTRDPSGYGGGVNLYGFAGDNPVNEMDPSGLDPLDPDIMGGIDGLGVDLTTALGRYEWQRYNRWTAGNRAWMHKHLPALAATDDFLNSPNAQLALSMDGGGGSAEAEAESEAASQLSRRQAFRGPAAKSFDWEHIIQNHSDAGLVAQQRTTGTVFSGLTNRQIMTRVQSAWKSRKLLQTQVTALGTRLRYRGTDPVSKEVVEFWFNKDTQTVETAYPIR
jgi:RHS repeat-associated protein